MSHPDILKSIQSVMQVIFLHFFKWKGSGHHDLDILKIIHTLNEFFRFMLAMITIRAEKHDHRWLLFTQLLF